MADPAIQAMLTVWNKPDAVGMACVHCHGSPNAAEFALVGISEADIVRRGLPHHDAEQIRKIVAGVEKLKQTYRIGQRNRDAVFLMQPGPRDPSSGTGTPLPGRHYWERDASFMLEELPRITPTLARRIDTLEQARQAIAELVATEDTTRFRVPFVSPFYSGDPARELDRGDSTASLNKWISIFPIQPRSPQWDAEITARRTAYMQHPSNHNFYLWLKAEEEGAGAFGTNMIFDGRSAPPATIDLRGFGVGGSEGGSSTFQLDYWTAEFEKRKRTASMVAFHQMLQESLGVQENLLAKGHYAFEDIGKAFGHTGFTTFNPFHGLGDDSGRPSAVRTDRLIYPSGLLERLGPGFRNHVVKSGQRGLDAVATDNAKLDAANWWLMSLTYDGGRRAPTMDIGYWALAMQNDYGLGSPSGAPREATRPGYAGFSAWAFLRGEFLDYAKYERYGGDAFRFPTNIIEAIDGINNAYGHASEEHRHAVVRLALNSVKLRLAQAELARQRALAEGRVLRRTNGSRAQFHVAVARRLAQSLPAAEVPAELAALDRFYGIWIDATRMIHAGRSSLPALARGTGDGLTATYFDDPAYSRPLLSEVVPRVWYSHQFVNGQSMPRHGAVFTGRAGAMDNVKGFNGTNHTTAGHPIPDGEVQGFSVQWSGYLEVPVAGNYDVYLHVQDGIKGEVRVEDTVTFKLDSTEYRAAGLNGHAAEMEASGRNSPLPVYGSRIWMEPGRRYKLEARAFNPNANNFHAHLVWEAPGAQFAQIIPAEYLYTSATSHRGSTAPGVAELDLPYQTLPEAIQGVPYSVRIASTGGSGPIRMRMGQGKLPPGLSFDNGLITGVPTQVYRLNNTGSSNLHSFSVIAFDASGRMSARRFDLNIGAP